MDVVNLWLVSSGRAIAKVRPQLVRKWVGELMQRSICRKPRLNSGGKKMGKGELGPVEVLTKANTTNRIRLNNDAQKQRDATRAAG